MKNLNILIAEDDISICELLSGDLLDHFGEASTSIDEATTVEEALNKIDSNKYDVIISDYHFRDNKGDLIRSHCPDIPFIFISGGLPTSIDIKQKDTYSLDKPFKAKDLHKTVRAALKIQ